MDLDDLRVRVYRWFADRGTAPTAADLAAATGTDEAGVRAGLEALHESRLLVLDRDQRDIVMAHPWSARPLGFVVAAEAGAGRLWWGGCAWDSFAIPSLVGPACLVATHCPGCGAALALDVRPDRPPAGDPVAHFLVPVARMWDDVVFTCAHQRLFCGPAHLDRWLHRTGNPRGAVLDLATLWRLATGWYAGRLDRDHRRRDPAEAAAFFESLGLTGRFWRTG